VFVTPELQNNGIKKIMVLGHARGPK